MLTPSLRVRLIRIALHSITQAAKGAACYCIPRRGVFFASHSPTELFKSVRVSSLSFSDWAAFRLTRQLLALKLLILVGLTLPAAQAHSTLNAGNVLVEWHTDTNEVLQVAGDSTLALSLQVAGKPLEAAQCRCTLLLYQGSVSPRTRPSVLPLQPTPHGFQAVITVKQAGPYSLVLDGKPVHMGDFAPFRTTFQLLATQDIYNLPQK
ncbi:hypothetical protein Dxin01_00488 [Deinococcus xinjiangensis]|uniref:Uncharacterized protein n=1 Tax=Deinococcus xinjiangensis TaxID=457454 RepID=A0ABP9V9T1_9DEIO